MSRPQRALVVGAGIAGLALSDRLAARGWTVTVVERAGSPRTEGYVVDFFGLGYDAAERSGLLPRLHELAITVDELAYVGPSGRPRARLRVERLARAVDGRFLSILRQDLERALRERVEGRAELRYGCRPATVENGPDGVVVTLSDATTLEVDLLVGADGIHSWVRRTVVDPVVDPAYRPTSPVDDPHLRSLGMHTATFTVDDPRLREAIGRRVCLTDTLNAMLGFYPLPDQRVAVFAAHRTDEALPVDPRAELQERYGSWPWIGGAAVAACPPGDEIYYDIVAQVEALRWHNGRVVLIGDACQAVSLVAGQGASLAVAGAAVLDAALATDMPIEQALARYEARWRPVVQARQESGRTGAGWFLPATRRARWLRRGGLLLATLPGLEGSLRGAVVGRSRVRLDDIDLDIEGVP
ncbi:FAD-dependent monooxygenase [Georgenia sp. MJ206]|uniref:FAD-dependent monooxygenase n=1 Tax=Georgenia wangjunii TaxID=3117730 RepID=UPI002F262A56